jgi:uncharacterized protein YsxB (DUF464 family)
MTSVLLVHRKDGTFRSCKAEGHSGFSVKGTDIVCAAVTVLLRTAMQVLSETDSVMLKDHVGRRGTVSFAAELIQDEPETKNRLVCIEDFLEDGLDSLQKEFPANVELEIKTEAF